MYVHNGCVELKAAMKNGKMCVREKTNKQATKIRVISDI
jgi:hypothetical protein